MSLAFEYLDPEKIIGSEDFFFVERFLKATGRTQIGWHYIIDLTWIYRRFKDRPPGLCVLDAGGGIGPAQFLLAELGHNVTNADLVHRSPARWQRRRYGMTITILPSYESTSYVEHLKKFGGDGLYARLKWIAARYPWINSLRSPQATARHVAWRQSAGLAERPIGHIELVSGNLAAMPEVESNRFNAVVSLSALEHIPAESLQPAIVELKRLLSPEAIWAITTSGTERRETWWHAPSQGHCFCESDLEDMFCAAPRTQKESPNEILDLYRKNSYLRKNLAQFYKKSGNNGMPWGEWNPLYVPCGIYEIPSRVD